MASIPQWAKDQRLKGTEIKEIGGNYYLSYVLSKWDPKIKRSRKKSGDYIGVLTPEGLVPAKRRLVDVNEPVLSKEFGVNCLLTTLAEDIRDRLHIRFPDIWQEIYAICILRIIRSCSFRYISERYGSSVISEALSRSSITSLLKDLGQRRQSISLFMKDFFSGERDYLIFDGTSLISHSEGMEDNQLGYNNKGVFDSEINLLYAFTSGTKGGNPAYYRKFPGSINDVSVFVSFMTEIGINDAVVIADKGFGSKDNFKDLDEA